jgi:hypothetical protein
VALANCPPETIFEICVDAAVRRGARLGIVPSAAAREILIAAEKDFGVPPDYKIMRLAPSI